MTMTRIISFIFLLSFCFSTALASDIDFKFHYRAQGLISSSSADEAEPECFNLSEAHDGLVKICSEDENSEPNEFLVVNGKIFSLTNEAPRDAFSCPGQSNIFDDSLYASDQEAIALSEITGKKVYTPLYSFIFASPALSSSSSLGRAYYVDSVEGEVIRDFGTMYSRYSRSPASGYYFTRAGTEEFLRSRVTQIVNVSSAYHTDTTSLVSTKYAYRACAVSS